MRLNTGLRDLDLVAVDLGFMNSQWASEYWASEPDLGCRFSDVDLLCSGRLNTGHSRTIYLDVELGRGFRI